MDEQLRLTAYPNSTTEKEGQLEELLRQDPKNLHAKKTLAFTYYTNHRYDAAMELYVQLVQQDGADPAVHFYMGNTLYRLQDFERAVASWQQAIDTDQTGIYRERAQQRIDMTRSTASAGRQP